jgi:hypothetical protein
VLILKNALKHDEFFTTGMHMWGEVTLGGIADHRSGTGYFIADSVQNPSAHAFHGRVLPLYAWCMQK